MFISVVAVTAVIAAAIGGLIGLLVAASRNAAARQRISDELAAARMQAAAEVAGLKAELAAERSHGAERLQLLMQAREELALQFKTLANDILEEKSRRFTEQNRISLEPLLEPLRTRLSQFQSKVEEVYVQEGKDRSALARQVEQLVEANRLLNEEARHLTDALKGSSKTQGYWGEMILEKVLESAGLRKGEEFSVQQSHTTSDNNRLQPDVVIHLPEDRHLVVDSKVSLLAYEALSSAQSDEAREVATRQHLESVRRHIKGLSEKSYQDLYGLRSLDFVIMFVPVEPAFMAAITHDRTLFTDAWQRNVLLVSPSTLLFVVRTVAHLWRQEAQTRNAQEIAQRGAELYDKFAGFAKDFETLGVRIRQAQEEFDSAQSKLASGRGNLIRQAEKLRELGIKPSKGIPSSLLQHNESDASSSSVPPAI
jgi:DNA recombination protein RmuC